MQKHLTVVGERASGKTRALIDMAIDEARSGGNVWFQSRDHATGRSTMKMTVDRIRELDSGLINRVTGLNGHSRILFANGAIIDFDGGVFWKIGKPVSLHVMDEVSSEPYPMARRSVRAVLR